MGGLLRCRVYVVSAKKLRYGPTIGLGMAGAGDLTSP